MTFLDTIPKRRLALGSSSREKREISGERGGQIEYKYLQIIWSQPQLYFLSFPFTDYEAHNWGYAENEGDVDMLCKLEIRRYRREEKCHYRTVFRVLDWRVIGPR